MEDAREDLGRPLIPEELSWLLGSLSSLFRLPFDGALVESQFPPTTENLRSGVSQSLT
ncbi:MAG: hypothetical protein NT159_03665 [Proteobacteria bacterium]|nr:hypothetical protein [Pseudomonadota bacterium]